MSWRPYEECCRERAASGAAICGECRNTLLRCPEYDRCGQLLEPDSHCRQHVQPLLALGEQGLARLTEGEVLSLPFRLGNAGEAALGQLTLRWCLPSHGNEWGGVELGRTSLQPRGEQDIHVDLPPLPAGQQRLKLQLQLQTALGGLEERYIFESAVLLRVAPKDTRTINISNTQNIDNSGASFGTGASGVVQTGDTNNYSELMETAEGGSGPPVTASPFRRNRSAEFAGDLRGYTSGSGVQDGLRIARNVEVECAGFHQDHFRPIPRPFLIDTILSCGRNSTTYEQAPNHLRLLQVDGRTGDVDASLSRQISGAHFDLLIQNDRLYVRDKSSNGTWHNKTRLEASQPVALQDKDTLTVLKGLTPSPLKVRVRLQQQGDFYSKITLERATP